MIRDAQQTLLENRLFCDCQARESLKNEKTLLDLAAPVIDRIMNRLSALSFPAIYTI